MQDTIVERYSALLGAHPWLTEAMSWTVVTGAVDVESVVRRLGGDPGTMIEQRPADADYGGGDGCRWYLNAAGGAVTLLEVNGYQANRSEVLRALSAGSDRVYSAFWNVERDNAFSYAVAGEVVTAFDGEFPDERWGSDPDALETDRAPLWAADSPWRASMLALVEVRSGVRLDGSWFDQPQLSVLTPRIPDDPPQPSLLGDIIALLGQEGHPGRHAALAWLAQTLAGQFGLDDPALGRAIEARRTGARIDEATKRQVRELTGRLVQRMPEYSPTMHLDPAWRRGQAALAACQVVDFRDAGAVAEHARLAFGDGWEPVAAQLRARL